MQRAVLFALFLREIRSRVGNQWIGAVWTLFEPLAHTLTTVSILGFLRGIVLPGLEYPVFLVTGLLPYFLFQNLILRLMDGIDANKGLFAYRQVKPLDCLVTRAWVETLMNILVYAFTLGLLAWMGLHAWPDNPLAMLSVQVVIFFLGAGVGLLCAVLGHERPRLRSFFRMALAPLYLASGIIFQVHLLAPDYLDWLLWNPMLHLVELSRQAFLSGYVPAQGVGLAYPATCMLVFCTLGLLAYRADRLRLVTSA